MSDWEITKKVFGANVSAGVISGGYNSSYCLGIYGECGYSSYYSYNGHITVKNTKYSSIGIMIVFMSKVEQIQGTNYGLHVGHTGYGNVGFPKTVSDWTKFRALFFFDDTMGYGIGILQKYDEETGKWEDVSINNFENVKSPTTGNFLFKLDVYPTGSSTTKVRWRIDNVEVYTWKEVSQTLSEQEKSSVSTST